MSTVVVALWLLLWRALSTGLQVEREQAMIVGLGLAGGLLMAFGLWWRQRLERRQCIGCLQALAEGEALSRPDAAGCPSGCDAAIARLEAMVTELRARAEAFERLADMGYAVEALFAPDGRLCWVNESIQRLTGHDRQTVLAAHDPVALLVHESDAPHVRRVLQTLARGQYPELPDGGDEIRLIRADGRAFWVACHWQLLSAADPRFAGVRLTAQEIQARKEAEFRLLESVAALRRAQALSEHYLLRSQDERQRLGALLDVLKVGILFMDRDHRVQYYNRAMVAMWRFPPDQNLIGAREVVLQRLAVEVVADPERYFDHLREVLAARRDPSPPADVALVDGRILSDMSAVVWDAAHERGIGRVWIYEDVTDERQASQRLRTLSERDALTQLYNRRRFNEDLERMIVEARRHGQQLGLLMLDLDGFKPINDVHGHQAGDVVLMALAEGLRQIVRRNELLYRLGGDEFALLVASSSHAELQGLCARLTAFIQAQSFEFGDDGRVAVGASIGVASLPGDAQDAQGLVRAADAAMYAVKRAGKNGWQLASALAGQEAVFRSPGPQ